jgi:hypothetical protein
VQLLLACLVVLQRVNGDNMFGKKTLTIDSYRNGINPSVEEKNDFTQRNANDLLRKMSAFHDGETNGRFKIFCGLMVALIFSILSVHFSVNSRASKEKVIYVQKPDGVTEVVHQLSFEDRTPQTIRNFAFNFGKTCFSWHGKFNGQIDPGVQFRAARIPTVLDKCRLAVEPNVWNAFLSDLVSRYTNDPIFKDSLAPFNFTGGALRDGKEIQVQVKPFYPKEISKGKWEIDVGMTRYIKFPDKQLEEPFNLTLTLASIPPYQDPLLAQQSDFGKLLNAWAAQGLKIENIKRK